MHHRSKTVQRRRLLVGALCLGALLVAVLLVFGRGWLSAARAAADPDRAALQALLSQPGQGDLRQIYANRGFRPIWIVNGRAAPQANQLVDRLIDSAADDLDPSHYPSVALRAALISLPKDSSARKAQVELGLTRTYGVFVADLHAPRAGVEVAYTDGDLRPDRPSSIAAITVLANTPSLADGLRRGLAMNPLYAQMRQVLAASDGTDPALRRLLQINLERLRALPVNLGQRFVLVDAAAQRLWMYQDGKPVDSMKVIVGKANEPTPAMAALIRYAVFNPYWNVPPDLTRATYAPRFLADPSTIDLLHMDAWSDSGPTARKLDPHDVNWRAVSLGAEVWLRQRPGANNFMGAVKFMFPNALGIYLHDTPDKGLFALDQRTLSAGCVRVEDYRRLAAWLYAGRPAGPKGSTPEQKVDLPAPVPVYITYLTAVPSPDGVILRQDIYGRDRRLLPAASAPAVPAKGPAADSWM